MSTKQKGFTIVELLTVIVVIAMLAVISLFMYSGIKERAQEASVRTDMRNIAKQVSLYKLDNRLYPSATQLQSLGVRVNKKTYGVNPTGATIFYCADNAGTTFSIVARVKSSLLLQYVSTEAQVTTYSGSATAPQLCLDSGVPGPTSSVNYTGFTDSGAWYSWVLE